MAIFSYYNKRVVIKKLKSAGGYKRTFAATSTIDAHLQRIDDSDLQQIYGVNKVSHKGWIDISIDIKEGDIIIDQDGNQYDVIGVSNRGEEIAMNEHKELLLNRYNPLTRGTP